MSESRSPGGVVCAVMVAHNAGSRVVPVIRALSTQVDHIVVVDNASDASSREILRELAASQPDGMTLILNEQNRWLAEGLNQAISWADRNGFDFVLLSSDTDVPEQGAVAAMRDVFFDRTQGRVGSVNPRVILETHANTRQATDTAVQAGGPSDIDLLVTGGCLVSMEAIRTVGPQREDFLIDMVDYDFGFRLQAAGFRTLGLDSVSMRYELGKTANRRFLWRTCSVQNYSPVRRYYFSRNGLTLLRETGNRALANFYWQFLYASIAKILIYEEDKFQKLLFIGRGLRDSMKGRLGPYEERLASPEPGVIHGATPTAAPSVRSGSIISSSKSPGQRKRIR